jgi:ubiquinone/menaquinone biosynthesis C-methylase UbiE
MKIVVIRYWLFRLWYRIVQYLDKNADVIFMNYGYYNPDDTFKLAPEYKSNRFSAQLYHKLVCDTEIADMNLLEVGSGRGGGLSYLAKYFAPSTALGVDINKQAVNFCNRYYKQKNLSFVCGDAQNLSFLESNSFDIIINVESSHRYPRVSLFFEEVFRLLRPNGYFLFTDFRYKEKLPELKRQLFNSGLIVLKDEVITKYVVHALEADDARKRLLVRKLVPIGIRRIALNFAATIGTKTYNKFASNKFEYYQFILQKPDVSVL